MTQVVFSGSTGTIANLNQNFTQLYALRELISDASYTAATPKMTMNAAGNVIIAAPTSGIALTATALAGQNVANFLAVASNSIVSLQSTSASGVGCGVETKNSVQTWQAGIGVGVGDSSWYLSDVTRAATPLKVTITGNVTITAPSSGTAFTVTAVAGALAASFPSGPLKTQVTTVASLLAAATAGAGARAFVTDANSTTFASVVAAGGANGVPVYSDGTNWRIG
jgi:hypothetical protein